MNGRIRKLGIVLAAFGLLFVVGGGFAALAVLPPGRVRRDLRPGPSVRRGGPFGL